MAKLKSQKRHVACQWNWRELLDMWGETIWSDTICQSSPRRPKMAIEHQKSWHNITFYNPSLKLIESTPDTKKILHQRLLKTNKKIHILIKWSVQDSKEKNSITILNQIDLKLITISQISMDYFISIFPNSNINSILLILHHGRNKWNYSYGNIWCHA